jgi:two-component system CheB/CheR fusion protein
MDARPPPAPGRSQDDWLRLFVQQTPDVGLILLDLERRITHWMGAANVIFGYAEEEVLGQSADLLFCEEDRQRGMPQLEMDEALRSPRAEDDRWHVRQDGTRLWISGSMIALRDEQGRPIALLKVVRDLTDRRTYVETLEHRLADRDRGKALRDVSVAALAHELRNPLGPLAHAVRMIRMTCDTDAVVQPLKIIDRQMAALKRLVDDLLDAGRVAVGTLQMNLEALDLNALLQDLHDALEPAFEEHGLSLHLIVPPTPICVEADRVRLEQALGNLLHNAMRYTPAGGDVWLKGTVEGNLAVMRVQDTGVGLSADTLPYIFDLFTRGSQAEQMAPSGMGVGLSVVKHIVQQHQGAIEVRSEGVGKGAEFSIRLPFAQPARGVVLPA